MCLIALRTSVHGSTKSRRQLFRERSGARRSSSATRRPKNRERLELVNIVERSEVKDHETQKNKTRNSEGNVTDSPGRQCIAQARLRRRIRSQRVHAANRKYGRPRS